MRKLPARKLLGTIITAALFMPQNAFTLGLGEIDVNSALNQKFNADIELLSASPEDAEDLIVKLASREEFQRAGIDRPYLLNDLRFKTEVKDGVPHILVSSTGPIREPYLNFLMEVDWPNGHLMREYTVLLDPPVFMTQSAAPATTAGQAGSASDNSGFRPQANSASAVVPVATVGTGSSSRPMASSEMAGSEQAAAQPVQASQPVASPGAGQVAAAAVVEYQPKPKPTPGNYRIKQGDTAWSLADAMRPDQSISIPQMMVALLRSNPDSFINENVNGLKRGYILRVPDYDQIATINQNDAIALVKQHAAMWREYQQNLAGKQPVTAMEAANEGKSSGSAGAQTTGDEAYLDIVSAGTGSSVSGSGKDPTKMSADELRAELALAKERVETERVEKEALQQRVDTLEQHVKKMKGMLAIEDNQMAEVQSLDQTGETEEEPSAKPAAETPAESSSEQPEQPADEAAMAETGAESGTGESKAKTLDEALASLDAKNKEMAQSGDETADETTMDTAEEGEAVFKDEQAEDEQAGMADKSSAEPSMGEAAPAVQAPEKKPVTPAPPPVVSQKPVDPLSKLLNNPMMLAAAGSGLLLVLALVALLIKRRKAAAENEAEATLMADIESSSSSDDLGDVADDIVEQASAQASADTAPEAEESAAPGAEETAGFDSDSTMILNAAEDTVVAEPTEASSQPEEEVRDDIIAEAEVYLAYGIYQQAEELLNQAISDNPDRNEYRVKLAETYYASKNSDAFVGVATELKDRVDGNSETWKKVLGMGQDLCADNPLFQGTMVGTPDVAALAPDVPEMDFDLGMNADEQSADTKSSGQDEEIDFGLDLPEEASSDADVVDESEDSDNELEFDLSETEAVAEAEASDDDFSLDIDASELDIDTTDEAEPASAEAVEDMGELDFALEETAIADMDSAVEETDEAIELDLSDEAESLDDQVAAIEDDEELAEAMPDEAELDLTEEAAELDMDFDLGDESEAAEAEKPEAESDVSEEEIALDLSDTGTDTTADAGEEDEFDLSSLDDVDEVSTKLDLARAYLDMGDHEGTRGILEEVLAEGNEEQKQEASELMAKLG